MSAFDSVQQFYTYPEFVAFTEVLVAEGRTTGPDQSAEMVHYTKLNLHRMHRWEKTFHLDAALQTKAATATPQIWWVITEPWCGDSSQLLTAMHRMAEASNGNIELRIILRDEHPQIMDQYLTNGGRSIPKLVALDKRTNQELFTWGPRPKEAQQMVVDFKANHEGTYEDLKEKIHSWYAKDKGQSIQQEFIKIL